MLDESIYLPENPKTISCFIKYHADDVWLTSFAEHADAFVQEVMDDYPDLPADEILHITAMRIKRHAIYYMQRGNNCIICKFERMDKYIYERGN